MRAPRLLFLRPLHLDFVRIARPMRTKHWGTSRDSVYRIRTERFRKKSPIGCFRDAFSPTRVASYRLSRRVTSEYSAKSPPYLFIHTGRDNKSDSWPAQPSPISVENVSGTRIGITPRRGTVSEKSIASRYQSLRQYSRLFEWKKSERLLFFLLAQRF